MDAIEGITYGTTRLIHADGTLSEAEVNHERDCTPSEALRSDR